jgi:O-acetylserine/cysteine efflux transporter
MPTRHAALAVAVAVVWGVNFVLIDVGLDTFPPLLFVALRFGLTAFPAVLFIARPPIPLRYVAGVGLFIGAGQFGLLFVGMHLGMPAGLASLVLQLQAPFTIALAVGFLGERLNRGQVAGGLVALSGMVVIASGRAEGVPLGALLLCVGAGFCWAMGNVVTRLAQAPSAAALLVWSSLFAPLPLGLLSLGLEGPSAIGTAFTHVTAGSLLALAYIVVLATGFGFGSWTWLMRRHPASRVAPFTLLVPPVGIVSAWIALGERPNAAELAGALVVLAGLAAIAAAQSPPSSRWRSSMRRILPVRVLGRSSTNSISRG